MNRLCKLEDIQSVTVWFISYYVIDKLIPVQWNTDF